MVLKGIFTEPSQCFCAVVWTDVPPSLSLWRNRQETWAEVNRTVVANASSGVRTRTVVTNVNVSVLTVTCYTLSGYWSTAVIRNLFIDHFKHNHDLCFKRKHSKPWSNHSSSLWLIASSHLTLYSLHSYSILDIKFFSPFQFRKLLHQICWWRPHLWQTANWQCCNHH